MSFLNICFSTTTSSSTTTTTKLVIYFVFGRIKVFQTYSFFLNHLLPFALSDLSGTIHSILFPSFCIACVIKSILYFTLERANVVLIQFNPPIPIFIIIRKVWCTYDDYFIDLIDLLSAFPFCFLFCSRLEVCGCLNGLFMCFSVGRWEAIL